MDKQVHVSITPSTILMTLLIGAGAALLWYLRSIVLLILTAVVISSAMEPGISFFRSRGRLPRVLAVTLMYLLVFGSVFGLIYFFFPPILADAQNFLVTVPQYLTTLNLPLSLAGIPAVSGADAAHQTQSALDTILSFRSSFVADTSQGAFSLLSSIFGGIFSFMIVMVLSFYFAIQETGVEDFLKIVTPSKNEEYVIGLWHRAQVKIGQWMQGQIIMSIIVSVTIYLGLVILRIPDALLIAVLTAVAEIIPIFGSFIAGIPATLIAYTGGGIGPGIFVACLFIIVNQFEGNLIHPLVVRKVVGVPPLLVLLAIIVGGELAGFLGVLLAVPLAAVLREAITDFERRKRRLAQIPKIPEPKEV